MHAHMPAPRKLHAFSQAPEEFPSLSDKSVEVTRSSTSNLLLVNLKSVPIVHLELNLKLAAAAPKRLKIRALVDSRNLDYQWDSP